MKKYNKLVRDKIPNICRANGDEPNFRILEEDDEYLAALCQKLHEEGNEIEADPSLEELADALEVIHSIGKHLGHSPEEIEAARAKKEAERGGFNDRILLTSTG